MSDTKTSPAAPRTIVLVVPFRRRPGGDRAHRRQLAALDALERAWEPKRPASPFAGRLHRIRARLERAESNVIRHLAKAGSSDRLKR